VYIGSEFGVLFTVVKTTVLLADISDFGAVNEVYKQCKLQCNFNGKAT
jgi:enamine deaminase RidA (YjgF/YER057c/UK114 family)